MYQTRQSLLLRDNKSQLAEMPLYANLVYADCIYESKDLSWLAYAYDSLQSEGILIVQTDYHSQHKYRNFMELVLGMNLINHLVWKNEWGNHPKDRMHQCYDDILIYAKGRQYKFYPERIQIPKKTASSKGLNPSGRDTKTATAWVDDITLTTVAKERVKKKNGKLVRWQKPLRLYDRIILPFSDEFDNILDPFMGSGSLAKWCRLNYRNYTGTEIDPEVYDLAIKNYLS
jgi:DNA modification methylase